MENKLELTPSGVKPNDGKVCAPYDTSFPSAIQLSQPQKLAGSTVLSLISGNYD